MQSIVRLERRPRRHAGVDQWALNVWNIEPENDGRSSVRQAGSNPGEARAAGLFVFGFNLGHKTLKGELLCIGHLNRAGYPFDGS